MAKKTTRKAPISTVSEAIESNRYDELFSVTLPATLPNLKHLFIINALVARGEIVSYGRPDETHILYAATREGLKVLQRFHLPTEVAEQFAV